MRSIAALLAFGSIMTPACFADVDWERLVIIESSTDQSQATNLLMAALFGVQYDSKRTVGDYLRGFPERQELLSEFAARYKQDQYYLTDGTVEYGFHLPLTQSIMSLLIPQPGPAELVVPMLCPTCDQDWPAGRQPAAGLRLKPRALDETDYTGIIIDCRGLDLVPCLFPVVLNERMQEVYSVNFADKAAVLEHGLVSYAGSEASAAARTGDNPLRRKAAGLSAGRGTDIRIPLAAAQRIHGSPNNLSLLRECRVAIISGQ